jgi:hypothetical protein
MRHLLALLVVLAAALALPASAAAAFPSRLSASGTQIVDGQGERVVFRGFNVLPVWDDHPGATWDAGHYRQMRAAGMNSVRFVLHWRFMEPRRGEVDARHLRTLDTAIAHARAAGLYVVLSPIHIYKKDLYVPAWARRDDPMVSAERDAHGYLRTLAARYRHEDAVAAIDLMNEPPIYPPDQDRVMRMHETLTRTVRRADPRRMVVVEPGWGNASMAYADLGRLRRLRNVVFSMHDYYRGGAGAGYIRLGELAASWNSGARHTSLDGSTYAGGSAREFEQHLLVNLRLMRRARIPLWIGEFGIDPDARGGERWIREKVALYRKYGVGYTWWLYGDRGAFAPLGSDGRLRPFVGLL